MFHADTPLGRGGRTFLEHDRQRVVVVGQVLGLVLDGAHAAVVPRQSAGVPRRPARARRPRAAPPPGSVAPLLLKIANSEWWLIRSTGRFYKNSDKRGDRLRKYRTLGFRGGATRGSVWCRTTQIVARPRGWNFDTLWKNPMNGPGPGKNNKKTPKKRQDGDRT